MLTKKDKIEIAQIIDQKIDVRIAKFADEVVELFSVLTERITDQFEKLNSKIDKGLAKLDEHNEYLNDHERRIEKLEEKVLTTS